MYTVKLVHEARIEMAEALEWYEEQQAGLAKNLFKEIDYYTTLISKNPFQFSVRFSEKFRIAALQTFPYILVYKIDEANKVVFIESIFHTSQNPHRF